MTSYAFWNNKGGVGKSFLCFISACEYAHQNKNTEVIVIDLCPQANVSEMILGGQEKGGHSLREQLSNPSHRNSVGGYLEQRLSSPFHPPKDGRKYVVDAHQYNNKIPKNLGLVCGDNLVEVLGEAVRQTSQLSVPFDAWKKVISWISDLKADIVNSSDKDVVFFIDCNPSFAIYTQLAISAADHIIVPFTADESSRRGMENIIALLYGKGDNYLANFSRLSFYKKAKEDGITPPTLHTFISNKGILFDGKPSKASKAATTAIVKTVENVRIEHKSIFTHPNTPAKNRFIDFPDYHAAAIVSSLSGVPMHQLKAGPKLINGQRIQINPEPLQRYNSALSKLVGEL